MLYDLNHLVDDLSLETIASKSTMSPRGVQCTMYSSPENKSVQGPASSVPFTTFLLHAKYAAKPSQTAFSAGNSYQVSTSITKRELHTPVVSFSDKVRESTLTLSQ